MALPSSPPLLPSDELPTVPSFPTEPEQRPVRPSLRSLRTSSRKRQYSDYESVSSDPLFSEATSEVEEDNDYDKPRRKRQLRGPWYNLRRTSSIGLRQNMARRERIRLADSGVWMSDDMSDDSLDSALPSQQRIASLDVTHGRAPPFASSSQTSRAVLSPEELAVKEIQHCLDTGQESVDISDLGMETVRNTTLAPLHQLIRHSHSDLTRPPSEHEFSSLTPSIQLFLSGNRLTHLPPELFRLTTLTVLSLRNNRLDTIPPCISNLSHVQELNIAQNNIAWLPYEMLDLMHCRGTHRQITVRPNPLVSPFANFDGPSPLPRPIATPAEFKEHLNRWGETSGAFFSKMKQWYSEEDVPWSMRHELELRLKLGRLKRTNYLQEASRAGVELKLCNEQLIYLASSAVRFFEVDGSPYRMIHTNASVNTEDQYAAVTAPLQSQPDERPSPITSSLFELALRRVQDKFNLNELCHDYTQDLNDLPESVVSGLRIAGKAQEYGNEKCSTCSRHFIVARAEWMEYWFNGFPAQDCLTQEAVVPFLRKGCSWNCARPNELGAFRF